MVHFTQYDLRALFYSGIRMTESLPPGYPIRLSADQGICAPPRGFSQLITAFLVLRLHRHPPWTYIYLAISSFPPSHLSMIMALSQTWFSLCLRLELAGLLILLLHLPSLHFSFSKNFLASGFFNICLKQFLWRIGGSNP